MSLLEKAKEKIIGVFTGDSTDQSPKAINTPEQQNLYNVVQMDYQVFKSNRQQIEPKWQEEQRFYMGDHWYGLRSDHVSKFRPNSVDNVAWSKIESIVGKLSGWDPFPDFQAQEPHDEQKARDLNDYMPYELKKIKFKEKYIRAIRTCVLHGPLIFKTIFDPTVEGGRGSNRYEGRNDIIPVDLGSFFPDPRVKDFLRLQEMGAIIINTRKPLEYFRERWPEQGKKVQSDNQAQDVEIYNFQLNSQKLFNLTDSAGQYDANTQSKTAGLIEYWYRGTPKMISSDDKGIFEDLARTRLSQGVDPSEAIAKMKGTMDGVHCIYVSTSGVFLEHKAYVYDHGKYPFTARTLFPDERNVWGKGFMRDMIKPQIMLNKFAEIAITTMAKSGNSAVVYEEGAITKPQTWKEQRSTEGAMLPVAQGRMNDWKELQGVNVPSSVFNMLNYYQEMLQKVPGQFDSSEGAPNSSVTSGEQAKALMAASSSRLNPVTDLISETLADVFSQYIELIAQFYTNQRIARVTGRDVSMSRDNIVSTSPTTFKQEMDDGQIEQVDVMEEYVPEFDIMVNIAAEKPTDNQYWIQMVFNLLPMADPITGLPMIDAEAVRYTIQNGRMESMDVIQRRIAEKAGQQQKIQEMEQQVQQLQAENQGMGQQLADITSQKQVHEQQQQRFDQEIKSREMNVKEAQTANQIMKDQMPVGGLQNTM